MCEPMVSWWILLSRASVNWVGLQDGPGTSGVSGSGEKCCRCLQTFSLFFLIQKSSYSSSFVSWVLSVITIPIYSGPSGWELLYAGVLFYTEVIQRGCIFCLTGVEYVGLSQISSTLSSTMNTPCLCSWVKMESIFIIVCNPGCCSFIMGMGRRINELKTKLRRRRFFPEFSLWCSHLSLYLVFF